MNRERTKRKLSGILSADVVGYSRLMEKDEEYTIRCLEENKKLIGELIEEYKGLWKSDGAGPFPGQGNAQDQTIFFY